MRLFCKKNVYKWYKNFKEGRESVKNEQRPGRPSTSTDEQNANKIKDLVLKNIRLTIRDLADTVVILIRSVNTILKILSCLRCVKFRLIPKMLNCSERKHRVNISKTVISDYQDIMKHIITGDLDLHLQPGNSRSIE